MSLKLHRTLSATVVTGALVLAGSPLLATAPATAVPGLPSLGCAVNGTESLSNLADVAIPDLAVVPALSTITAPADGVISWLRVRTDITHTNPADLVVSLISPLGDEIVLTSGNGGVANDVFDGTWWDDDAGETIEPGSAAEATYVNGVAQTLLAPEEALANLRGQDVSGLWTLKVLDQVPTHSGSIEGWALEYATRDGGAPDVRTVSSGSLAGIQIPAGGSQSFTYDAVDDVPGSVEDVAADLDITGDAGNVLATLTSPAGTVITLTNGNGGVADSFLGGTTFADLGGLVAGPVSDLLATLLGHIALVAPQEPLSGLLGESTAGVWTLDITNLGNSVPLTLNGWGLDLTSSTCGLDGALTQLTQVPANLPAGATFTYAVAAVNDRLAPLTGGELGLVLPDGLELVSVTSTLGSCTGLTCVLGTLAPGGQAVVVYVLKAVTDGLKTVTVTLGSGGLDSLPLNNVLSFVTNIAPGPPGSASQDTTAPSLMILLGKDKLAKVAKKGVLAALAWTEAGKLTLKVKLPGKLAKRLKLPTVIGKRTVTTTKAGTVKLRLKVSKKAAKKLAKSRTSVRIVVKGRLRDAAGNVGKATAGGSYKH